MAQQQVQFGLNIKTNADLSGIEQLKRALAEVRDIANTGLKEGGMDASTFNEVAKAANDMERAFNKAFDPKLGVVNLNKLNKSLKESGTSLQQMQRSLAQAGPAGQKAFLAMTSQVLQMNRAVKQTNDFMTKLAQSFGNTLRYQVMNAAINKISGSISQAYGYVKNLDSSLNDIQIVTEKSSKSMQDFAKQANEAAKGFGASTTDYTKASLIYYQQGLSDEEVAGRTDTTMKMANVLGESASQVSDYMTAIWNNFDDGSKSLEYYGDVITKLGAETAASSAEIADGLSKFAAVADTVGLSYEYATAALATVVAETRQSADTVGTAFKTLFARIQGLKLGETLEDGTDLNKYSQALMAVGISVKDQNGQLKDMDTLLDEMGAKWQTLAKDQQVALAQTVAGTRQYTQLVALMENWEEVQKNINVAKQAEGTLDTKNLIHMQSIEARTQAMRTQWEAFYKSMISEKDLINLAKAMEGIGKFFTNFAQSIGGLGPLLGMVGSTGLKAFGTQISGAIVKTIGNIDTAIQSTSAYQQNLMQLKTMFKDSSWMQNSSGEQSVAMQFATESMLSTYDTMNKYRKILTEEELTSYNNILKEKEALGAEAVDLETNLKNWQALVPEAKSFYERAQSINDAEGFKKLREEVQLMAPSLGEVNDIIAGLGQNLSSMSGKDLQKALGADKIDTIKKSVNDMSQAYAASGMSVEQFRNKLKNMGISQTQINKLFNTTIKEVDGVKVEMLEMTSTTGMTGATLKKLAQSLTNADKELKDYVLSLIEAEDHLEAGKDRVAALEAELDKMANMKNITNNVIQVAGSVGQLAMAINNLKSLGNIIDDDQLSGADKAIQIVQNLAMTLPMLIGVSSTILKLMGKEYGMLQSINLLRGIKQKSELAEVGIKNTLSALYKKQYAQQVVINLAEREGSNIKKEEVLATLADEKALKQLTKAKLINMGATKAEASAIMSATAAQTAFNASVLSNPYIAMAVAIIALISLISTSIWKSHINNLESQAAAAEAAAKKSAEYTEELKKEAETVRTLAEEYDNLKNNWDDLDEDDKRLKVYELCLQYEQQALAIKALTGNYKELDEAITQTENNINNQLENSSIETIGAAQLAISERSEAYGKKTTGVGSDLKGEGTSDDVIGIAGLYSWDRENIRKELSDLGVNVFSETTENDWSSNIGGIKVQDFAKAVARDKESFETFFETFSDDKAVKKLKAYYDSIAGSIDILASAYSSLTSSIIFSDMAENGQIETLEEYNNRLDMLAEKLYDTGAYASRLEAYRDATKSLSTQIVDENLMVYTNLTKAVSDSISDIDINLKQVGSNSINDYINNEEYKVERAVGWCLADTEYAVKDKDGNTIKQFEEASEAEAYIRQLALDEMSKATEETDNKRRDFEQKFMESVSKKSIVFSSFLAENIDLFDFDIDNIDTQLDEIEKRYSSTIAYMEKKSKIQISVSVMQRATERGQYTEEDIDELFKDRTFLSNGVSKKNFKESGFGNQQLYNLADYIEQQKNIIEDDDSRRKVKLEQQSELDSLQWLTAKQVGGISDYALAQMKMSGQNISDVISRKENSIRKSLRDYSTENSLDSNMLNQLVFSEEEYDDTLLEYYNSLTEEQQEYIDGLRESGVAITSYHRQAEILTSNIANLNAGTIDYTEAIENLNIWLDREQASIEEIKKSYTSLQSACEDYNNNQALTSESLNDLLNMSPQYLRYLQMENEELQINTQAMEDDTRATIALEAAEFAELQLSQLKKAVQDGTLESYLKTTAATLDSADASWTLAEAALDSIDDIVAQQIALKNTGEEALQYAHGVRAAVEAMKGTFNNFNLDNFYGKASSTKSSKSKNKELKELDDEFDRYYRLKKAISDVENELSDLNKLQSHLNGKQLIESLRMQNDLLKEQKVRYQDLIAEQQKEGAELKGLLSDFGVTFSSDNNISNYGQIATQMLDEYNKAVEDFNAGLLDDTAFEIAEKRYNDFKKGLDRYKNLLKEYQDSYDKLDDIYYKELENNLKAWKLEIQLELDTTKMEREWNDFIRNLDKDITLRFQDTDSILEDANFDMESLAKDKATEESAMDEIMKEIFNFESNPDYKSDKFASLTEAQEALKDYRQKWMDTLNDIAQARQDAYDAYLQSIDDEAEKISEINDEYDRLADKLSHISKMNELLYGPDNYDTNDKIMQAEASLDRSQMSNFRAQYEENGRLYEMALEQGDEQAAKKYKDLRDEALDNLYAKEEEYIEKLNDIRSNAAKKITDEYYKALYGMSKDDADREWDKTKALNEGKYDDTQRLYQETTFQNKANKVIENASLKYQGKLKDAVEAINKDLQSREELTEYDIQLAEKKLAILEAEAALEDAQNNKNTMKLTRGADGNWSYQYVADEGDVADKQQALLNANNEFYELAKSHNEELVEMMNQYYDDYIQRQQELLESGKYTDEEAKKLYDEYYGSNGYITVIGKRYHQNEQDLAEATVSMAVTQYKIDEDSYARMSAEKQRLIDDTKDKNITSLADIVTADADARENILTQAGDLNKAEIEYFDTQKKKAADSYIYDPDSVQNMVEDAMDAAKDAQEDWTQAVDEGCEAAGEDFGDIETAVEDVQIAVEDLDDATVDMASNAAKALAGYAAAVANLKAQYDGLIGGVRDYEAELQRALQAQAALAGSSVPSFGSSGGYSGGSGSGGGNGTGGSDSSDDPRSGPPYVVVAKKTVQGKVYDSHICGFSKGTEITTEDGKKYSFNSVKDMKNYIQDNSQGLAASGERAPIVMSKEDFERYGYDPKFSFDTGGYTGSWNDGSGKLAMLHSKELVLNADDTQNMLETVSAVRSLATIGSSITDAIADSIVNIFGGLGSNLAFAGAGSTSNNSVNNFDITMNVDGGDVQAIQEAILSLPNLASQFLSKNLK